NCGNRIWCTVPATWFRLRPRSARQPKWVEMTPVPVAADVSSRSVTGSKKTTTNPSLQKYIYGARPNFQGSSYLRRCLARAGHERRDSDRGRHNHPVDPEHTPQHSLVERRHGYGDRLANGCSTGSTGGDGDHPSEYADGSSGRRSRPGQEI